VVSPGEELWVKIIDIDLQRRRISLSIKQAYEGGEVAPEYREHFGEHAYDEHGNYIGGFEPETESQKAWADYVAAGGEVGPEHAGGPEPAGAPRPVEAAAPAAPVEAEPVAGTAQPDEEAAGS
jgi:small subunit ribosomal protein S1